MTVGAYLLFGLVFISFAASPGNAGRKSRWYDTDLASLIIQQNGALITLVKDQQSIITRLEILKRQMEAQFKDLADKLGTSRPDPTVELKDIKKRLDSLEQGGKRGGGSIFIRWGRTKCPALENGATTQVYSGIVGGKYYGDKGGGTNPLCLTKQPKYDGRTKPGANGFLYGSEYSDVSPAINNNEVPCSVCRTTYAYTIMIPGTNECPKGWSVQYSGHLASEHKNHAGTQFVCLDKEPEGVSPSKTVSQGLLFYMVVSKCGSLPCPPYLENKVVTCVVCSQ